MTLFAPPECLALLAVFTDACKEVDLLANISQQKFSAQANISSTQWNVSSNPDTLLTELNKIFFQTLLRYEKARSEDYLELPDGTYRKLNEEESTNVRYVEIVTRISTTLKSLLLELEHSGTIQSLEKYCHSEQAELEKLEHCVTSASKKEKQLVELHQEVQRLQRVMDKDALEYAQTIERIKHEFQELRDMSRMTLTYKSKEYATKMQHNLRSQANEMKHLNEKVDRVKAVIAQASRCGETTASWLHLDIANICNLAEFIPTNEHPAIVAKNLTDIQAALEEATARRVELQERFNYCSSLVARSKIEKENIRLREDYARKFLLSVLQIQCWWRAVIEMRGIKKKRRKKGKKGGKK